MFLCTDLKCNPNAMISFKSCSSSPDHFRTWVCACVYVHLFVLHESESALEQLLYIWFYKQILQKWNLCIQSSSQIAQLVSINTMILAACLCVYLYISVYLYVDTCTHECIHMCMSVHMCVCVCIYMWVNEWLSYTLYMHYI